MAGGPLSGPTILDARGDRPLLRRLPQAGAPAPDLLDLFLDYASERKLTLYPAQEEAILELYSGKNVILNTPTGSGKSLVATALHFHSLASGRRSVYTCPIKALVNEKFLALCQDFGPENVGMITGDAVVNGEAPILCCTAEILANDALRFGSRTPVDDIVMDEFHYYSDRERGVAWQVPLLTLPHARFLLMSATLGDTERFAGALNELTGRETAVVRGVERPVPLDFEYSEDPIHEKVSRLMRDGKAPIYLVCFTQRECAEQAQNLLSVDFCSKEEKRAIADALAGTRFASPYGKEISRFLRHGVGVHHAGLLPKYRVLVERLAQAGLLKVICGTDTLGVGVNIPIRTVLFTQLCKFDGQKTAILAVRDFHQISGRAGRKGFDDRGYVVAQAPAHVIENLQAERKAEGDAKKTKKLVKRKPPEKGYVPWTRETFEKLRASPPEPLVSRFQVNHGMLLLMLSREPVAAHFGDPDAAREGCTAMRRLIHDSHESDTRKRQLGGLAFQLFRDLVKRKIVDIIPPAQRAPNAHGGIAKLRVNVDLQRDFSLHQTLSLYLLDTLKLLDPADPDYVLDALSLVEAILENPDVVLRKQLDRLKTERMAELKAQGMEFEDRIAELETMEYPKPRREFIYDTFNAFAAMHPWVGQGASSHSGGAPGTGSGGSAPVQNAMGNVRPKSIAREMFETFASFPEYIREYELQRSEGLLLRYLSDVYKTLVQTVPPEARALRAEEFAAVEDFLGAIVRQVDSSLIDEWERLRNPSYVAPERSAETGALADDITRNRKGFLILVRAEIFRVVRAIARKRYVDAVAAIPTELKAEQLAAQLAPYWEEHAAIRTDTTARANLHTLVREESDGARWVIQQVLVDPDGHNDWALNFDVNLAQSRELGAPALTLRGASSLGSDEP